MKINELLIKAYKVLKENDIDTYMLDSQVLLAHVLKQNRMFITLNRDYEVSEKDEVEFERLIALRKDKKPIKYLIGECEFMGIDFYVEEGVLIPRPDTEILVEEALKNIKEKGYLNVCDVCCGSGAIGLSVAHHSQIENLHMIDISDIALKVSGINNERIAKGAKVQVFKSNLLEESINNGNVYDCILSNPPYIESHVIPTLMDDVRDYEPHLALDGGEDGLIFYRKITSQSKKVLKSGGMLAYEIGHNQKEAVIEIMELEGFKDIRAFKDYGGNDRVVLGFL